MKSREISPGWVNIGVLVKCRPQYVLYRSKYHKYLFPRPLTYIFMHTYRYVRMKSWGKTVKSESNYIFFGYSVGKSSTICMIVGLFFFRFQTDCENFDLSFQNMTFNDRTHSSRPRKFPGFSRNHREISHKFPITPGVSPYHSPTHPHYYYYPHTPTPTPIIYLYVLGYVFLMIS